MTADVTAFCTTCNKGVLLPHHHGRHEWSEDRVKICVSGDCILNPYEDPVDPRTYQSLIDANKVRDMARLGQSISDQSFGVGKQIIDFGKSVIKIAEVIDECDECSSYVWINSSNTLERLSIKKVIMYHFGDHVE